MGLRQATLYCIVVDGVDGMTIEPIAIIVVVVGQRALKLSVTRAIIVLWAVGNVGL